MYKEILCNIISGTRGGDIYDVFFRNMNNFHISLWKYLFKTDTKHRMGFFFKKRRAFVKYKE